MVHPDYQYTPKLIPSMAWMIANGLYHVVLGSRILGRGALSGGMPRYKYFFNRILTFFQNLLMKQKLSEYHTGYRAFSREVLEKISFMNNSDDFVFDNQMLAQIFYAGYEIAEVTCPTKYFTDASSINFSRSSKYGLGVMKTAICYFLQKLGLAKFRIFETNNKEQAG
jgi:glycosyltransferase involved in cell wall biosynthesis